MTEQCSNCRFFAAYQVAGVVPNAPPTIRGHCRLNPPPFPNVKREDWCGQYQKMTEKP